jgi:hypothetical protein
MKLLAFPEGVLQQGLQELKRSPLQKDPFQWLVGRMRMYCKLNDIEINWKEWYYYREVFRMPENSPMTLDQSGTDRHELGTKRHDFKKLDVFAEPAEFARKNLPPEDPVFVIDGWEKWVASEVFPKASAIAGPVSPHVAYVIYEKRIPDAEIERLYATYPFLKPFMEDFIAKKEAQAKSVPKSYSWDHGLSNREIMEKFGIPLTRRE